jgi:hypothetical protein
VPAPIVFGDAEAAVCEILRDSSLITAIAGVTVATDPARRLRVTRTGGIPTLWMRLDNPVIAVAAYAPDKGSALDLARAARAAIYAARGHYIGNGLALYDVMDADGLSWSPDEQDPDQARYLFTLALVAKPA